MAIADIVSNEDSGGFASADTDPVLQYARDRFGIDYLFPYQRLVVANLLDAAASFASAFTDGRDGGRSAPPPEDCDDAYHAYRHQIVILPTGAGKSLCFQLPALLLPGPTVVVYPLLSLMADQERRLEEAQVGAVVLRGGQNGREREECFRRVRNGSARLLLSNPETLSAPKVTQALRDSGFIHIVVDEAHCLTEWGKSFRPAYMQLPAVIRDSAIPLVTAFTATASPEVLAAVEKELFGGERAHIIEGNPDRPNVSYRVVPTMSKLHSLKGLLGAGPWGGRPGVQAQSPPPEAEASPPLYPEYNPVRRPAVVFCRSRRRAELAAERLRDALPGQEIYFYHAGLTREEKKRVERWFFSSRDGVLCATCAYGLGVDKADIRTVIHLDLPVSVEAYLQESGRGGRDRGHAEAIALTGPEDDEVRTVSTDAVQSARERRMREYLTTRSCRRSFLLGLLGAEPEVCFGCDVCAGRTAREPAGLRGIVELARRAPRRHTTRSAAEALSGGRFGEGMAGWAIGDLDTAVRQAIRTGLIRKIRRGPWKGLITRGARRRQDAGRQDAGARPPDRCDAGERDRLTARRQPGITSQ